MPYLKFYLQNTDKKKHNVHVLYWNRDGREDELEEDITYHEFSEKMDDDIKKYKKIHSFLKFRKVAVDILDKEKYDLVFLLHSMPAVLLHDYVKKNYRNRYIFDYRDYTYEKISFYKKIIHSVVKNSMVTFVSSDDFRRFLPDSDKIYTSHNLLTDSLNYRIKKEKHYPVRIGFWGYIRHENINRQIIKKISQDKRFELHFYGREQAIACNLKKYASEINAENVFFHGEYNAADRYKFAAETDIIHNAYGNDEMPSQKYAVSNKYYDGLIFYIPQMCTKQSYMGDKVEKEKTGIAFDFSKDNFTEELWQYYNAFDYNEFCDNCDKLLDKILREFEEGKEIIKNAIES